jgi:hypothetical protein
MAMKTFTINHRQVIFTDMPKFTVITDLGGENSTSKKFDIKSEAILYYNIKCKGLCATYFQQFDEEIRESND